MTDRLTELAVLVRHLEYGDMIDLANGLWALKPNASPGGPLVILQADMPDIWHRWAETRKPVSPPTAALLEPPCGGRVAGEPEELNHEPKSTIVRKIRRGDDTSGADRGRDPGVRRTDTPSPATGVPRAELDDNTPF